MHQKDRLLSEQCETTLASFCVGLCCKLNREMARPNTNIEWLSSTLWPLRRAFPAPFSSSGAVVSGFLLLVSLVWVLSISLLIWSVGEPLCCVTAGNVPAELCRRHRTSGFGSMPAMLSPVRSREVALQRGAVAGWLQSQAKCVGRNVFTQVLQWTALWCFAGHVLILKAIRGRYDWMALVSWYDKWERVGRWGESQPRGQHTVRARASCISETEKWPKQHLSWKNGTWTTASRKGKISYESEVARLLRLIEEHTAHNDGL